MLYNLRERAENAVVLAHMRASKMHPPPNAKPSDAEEELFIMLGASRLLVEGSIHSSEMPSAPFVAADGDIYLHPHPKHEPILHDTQSSDHDTLNLHTLCTPQDPRSLKMSYSARSPSTHTTQSSNHNSIQQNSASDPFGPPFSAFTPQIPTSTLIKSEGVGPEVSGSDAESTWREFMTEMGAYLQV